MQWMEKITLKNFNTEFKYMISNKVWKELLQSDSILLDCFFWENGRHQETTPTSQLGWHSEKPPSSARQTLKIYLKKGKNIYTRRGGTRPKPSKKKQKEKANQTTTEIHSWASQFCLERNPYATPLEACPTKHNPELGHSNITDSLGSWRRTTPCTGCIMQFYEDLFFPSLLLLFCEYLCESFFSNPLVVFPDSSP